MARNPAFLFYPDSWIGGTHLLSRLQRGGYHDILMEQFNDPMHTLSPDQIRQILGSDYDSVWPAIMSKFISTSDGRLCNERLNIEIDKRTAYCESRGDNKRGKRMSRNTIGRKSYDNHMISYDNHMGNRKEETGNRKEEDGKEGGAGGTPKQPENSLHTQIIETWFRVFEEVRGVKPAFIRQGKGNYPKAAQALAAFGRPIGDYEKAIRNGFSDSWHGPKMELGYLADHFNELLTWVPPKPKQQIGPQHITKQELEDQAREFMRRTAHERQP